MVKINKRNLFLEKFACLSDDSAIECSKCKFIIGHEKKMGPKKEMCLCLLKESIFFIKSTIDFKQKKLGRDLEWKELVNEYPEFMMRKKFNFYKEESSDEGNLSIKQDKIDLKANCLSLYKKYEYKCQYKIQCYLCDENSNNDGLSIISFLEKVQNMDGFMKAEPVTNKTYLSNDIDDCVIYDLDFERYYNLEIVDAEQRFAFESIQKLLESAKNQAFIWLQKDKKTLPQDSSANVHIMCQNIEFGNLNSPFNFFKSSKVHGDAAKLSVLYDQRLMCILLYHENMLHKFEVEFNILESFICINEGQLFFDVFIPCKRPLSIYREPTNIITEMFYDFKKVMIESINEENIDWEKISFKNHDWTIKLQFQLSEKCQVYKALESISFNRILFSKVSNISAIYTIDDLRSAFQSKDFEIRYYLGKN
jgi:hypothetical protein